MNKNHIYIKMFIVSVFLVSCTPQSTSIDSKDNRVVLVEESNYVRITKIKKQTFNYELISNGKVSASSIADMKFICTEMISEIYVKNGDRVNKGQKLAELDQFRLHNKTIQALNSLQSSSLELQDILIGQGYTPDVNEGIPDEILKIAQIRSGYNQNLALYNLSKYEEEQAVLLAPFDGVVANLFTKPFNLSSVTETFCSIIDSDLLTVDFNILENELPFVNKGDKVIVTPYSINTNNYEGFISDINPVVDDNGMVKIKAEVKNHNRLFIGMNVRINILRSIDEQIVLPKSAVLLRSGKQVVFTIRNGEAYWNYVNTGFENSDSYTIINSDLREGDDVIISGNINLAHKTPIIILEK